ncbi:Phospholipase A and acyltransferase [Dirofilaria immitis]
MQAERLCSYLEIGDLIEFRRVVGNIKRRIYTHWGVFIGFHDKKAYIAHTGTDFGDFDDNLISSSVESLATIGKKVSRSDQIQIRRDELITVANGDSCRVNNSLDKGKRPFPPVIVVDRALRMLGKTNYNLLLNNCEHFAKYCRYGLKESNQATVAKIIIISSATYCITGSLAVSAVILRTDKVASTENVQVIMKIIRSMTSLTHEKEQKWVTSRRTLCNLLKVMTSLASFLFCVQSAQKQLRDGEKDINKKAKIRLPPLLLLPKRNGTFAGLINELEE